MDKGIERDNLFSRVVVARAISEELGGRPEGVKKHIPKSIYDGIAMARHVLVAMARQSCSSQFLKTCKQGRRLGQMSLEPLDGLMSWHQG